MSKILSIIIPLYNSAKWLPKCLDSLFKQDLAEQEYEIICVDDGSPDNSRSIAEFYGKRHTNLKVISQLNQGTAVARNTGMKNSEGKYLCFVDPDDYVDENVYGGLVRQMEEEQLDMLRFAYRIVDEDYKELELSSFEKDFDYTPKIMTGAEYLGQRLGMACYVWTNIYRASIIKDNNIWCIKEYLDDTPWLPQVCMKVLRLNVTDKIVYNYYQRREGLVRARSPQAISKIIEGQKSLILELQKQEQFISDVGVSNWYKSMKAACVVSLLSMVCVYQYNNKRSILKFLKAQSVFPLSAPLKLAKINNKIRILNVSPNFYCMLVHFKNRERV